MTRGAASPEELELLLEDAILLGDAEAIGILFTHHGALAADGLFPVYRGIEMLNILASWNEHGVGYVGGPTRIVQARRTALIIGQDAISVARRSRDGSWRFAICSLPNSDG